MFLTTDPNPSGTYLHPLWQQLSTSSFSTSLFSLFFFNFLPENSRITTFFFLLQIIPAVPSEWKCSDFAKFMDHFLWVNSLCPPFLLDHVITQHLQLILFCNLLFLWFSRLDTNDFPDSGRETWRVAFKNYIQHPPISPDSYFRT